LAGYKGFPDFLGEFFLARRLHRADPFE